MSNQDQNSMVAPTSGGSVFDQSSNAYTGGTQGLMGAANPYALNMTMNQFINPYREQVLNDAVSRMRDRQAQDLNSVRAQAAQSGAYGGARQGLVEAELMDRYGRNENELVSRLLQEGYTSSANLGLAALQQQTAASQGLVNAAPVGFNLGQGALGLQQQAGAAQQQMNQSILGQAAGQYQGYANYPQTALGTAMAGLQGNPLSAAGTQTSTFKPGLFNWAQMGANAYAAGK